MTRFDQISIGFGWVVERKISTAVRYLRHSAMTGLTALSLSACNEPPGPTATAEIMLGAPVSRAVKFTAGFGLLTGCGPQQTLELNAGGALENTRLRIQIEDGHAALLELGTNDPALGSKPFNGWYSASHGTIIRQALGNNWVHLTIDANSKAGGGTWQPQGEQMPKARVHIEGRFKQVAGYGFGGQTPCPTEVQ